MERACCIGDVILFPVTALIQRKQEADRIAEEARIAAEKARIADEKAQAEEAARIAKNARYAARIEAERKARTIYGVDLQDLQGLQTSSKLRHLVCTKDSRAFLGARAFGGVLHEVTGPSHKRISLGTALLAARFAAVRSFGHQIGGDGGEHLAIEKAAAF